ncbi:expressed protein [Batrachochytrium dendrobatidis JAM81]|uniref:Expressed protein n=1 Tax=Batrachochytrium dendrobatidis (strain JAM81 / FGSC 10211) TaxID=684364 RepID=F4P052_BATDJ|nr:uncharacterized protein BATDEDRAFT_34705 [Batrachochytrium dendrobatidis JAM81]EGF81089.1 expressed protein [Batrachochytrium dendrobatidis JAM81]|eukprot:XP_006677982.1 expressed protein [Batrachochytrium dendrobatidis JAM81]
MRLAVAVLSSILLALSVTTASPVNPSATTDVETSTSTVIPSATTSTEYSLWIVPNPNGIGLGALDALPDNVKHLLDKYVELQDARNQQSKIYWPLKSQYDSQYDVVLGVEKDLEILKYQSQKGNGNPKYGDIEKTKLDLEDQRSKLVKLRKDLDECESEIGHLAEKKWEADKQIVSLVFGTPLNPDLFNYQLLLIKETPSVKDYLEEQLSKYKDLGQNHGDQQRQDSQSSLDTLSESGSNRKSTSNKRKRVSKLVDELKSFFKRPKHDDPSN